MGITSIFQGIGGLLGLLAVGLVMLAVARAGQGRPMRSIGPILILIIAGAVAFAIIGAGIVFIEPNERGVIISPYDSKGYRAEALGPGLHWIIPGERVITYLISRQTYTMSVATAEGQVQGDDSIRARAKDGQEVYIDASIIYSIDPNQVVALHINWQNRYEEGVVRAVSRGTIRDAASLYSVEEIISSKRAEMESYIVEALSATMTDNYLKLEQFVLRDIHFSEEYATAVEQKQIAEQQAKQAAFVVEQRKQEAQQAIETARGAAESVKIAAAGDAEARKINADGEAQARLILAQADAESLKLIAAALKSNPDLLTYQYIQKLAPNVQVMYLPSDQPYLLPLPTTTP